MALPAPSAPVRTLEDLQRYESHMPLDQRIPPTIYRLFEQLAQTHGSRTALSMVLTGADDERPQRLSYAGLHARITQAANLFASLGGPGVGVAFMLPSLFDTHAVLWGAESAGYAVPLNPLLLPEQLAQLIAASRARILVTCGPGMAPGLWDKCQAIRARLPDLQVLCIGGLPSAEEGGGSGGGALPALDFASALQPHGRERLGFQRADHADEVIAYFHTGGTTGTPKLVAHTHRNQLTAALGGGVLMDLRCDDVMTNGMPLFHVGGAIACSLALFMRGAHVLMLSPQGLRNAQMVQRYWRIVENHGVTLVCAVPTALSAILAQPVDGRLDTVRCGLTGSAPTPRSQTEKFAALTGRPLHEILGMTESGGVTAIDPVAGSATPGSVGLRLPYTQLQVLRRLEGGQLGAPCEPHEIGALVVSGPNVSPGYLNAAHNAGVFDASSVHSGDLAYLDEEGKLFIAGRAKDLIIRSGHNIDPAMIEAAFTAHPQVALAAAVGQPDAYAGELPVCYVCLVPGASVTQDELAAFARERIAERPAWPRQVYILDSLPLTGVGKIFKPALRADAAEQVLRPLLQAAAGARLREVAASEGGPRGLRVRVTLTQEDAQASAAIALALGAFVLDYTIEAG
ncbi:Long-chain-fatty-acid--CoA ligase [Delftia tsuruhatensis]|nr:Long-chain-fatty-acid--CoA ligase [Delftia tsuruhatensis]CAC9675822.1 Long-chain-fatty-acid--CoA ligase [Delftia tsuruhatensis]